MTSSTAPESYTPSPEDWHMLNMYFGRKAKERFAASLSERDRTAVFQVVMYILDVSEQALAKVEESACYQEALGLCSVSVAENAVHPRLVAMLEGSKARVLEEVEQKQNGLRDKILGKSKRDYRRLVASNRIDLADQLLRNALRADRNARFAEQWQKFDSVADQIRSSAFELSLDLLNLKVSEKPIHRQIAFLVCNPERLTFSYIYTLPEWETFPMKWAALKLPVSTIYDLLNEHLHGEDVSHYFLEQYERRAGFADLEAAMRGPILRHALGPSIVARISIMEETIKAYQARSFGTCVYTSLPLIEGLLWDYADYLHVRGYQIFCNDDKTAVVSSSGKVIQGARIRHVVEQTHMRDHLDAEFVRHFVTELYDERNAILHGRVLPELTPVNAARKLAVVEYLLENIVRTHEGWYFTKMDNALDADLVERVLDIREAKKAERGG